MYVTATAAEALMSGAGGRDFNDSPQRETYLQFRFAVFRGDHVAAARCVNPRFTAYVPGHHRIKLGRLIEVFTALHRAASTFGTEVTTLVSVEEPGELCVFYQVSYLLEPELRAIKLTVCDWTAFDDEGKILQLRTLYDLNDLHQRAFGIPLPKCS